MDHRPVFRLTPEATPSWSRHTEKSLSFPVTLVQTRQLLRDILHVKSLSPGAPDELRSPGHTRPVFPSRTGAQSPAGASTSGEFWALGLPQSPLPLTPAASALLGHTACLVSVGHWVCDVSDSGRITSSVTCSHIVWKQVISSRNSLLGDWIRSPMGEADSPSQVNEPCAPKRIYKYAPERV